MLPFLQCVARAYADKYSASSALPDLCFVFPSKRAGTFFLKYIKEYAGAIDFAPAITTISDFVADLSGRVVNTRLDTLFLLHKCYCDIVRPHLTLEGQEEYLSFDAFRRWGETVLNDFNEIDIHLAPAEAIYKNLYDFRSIASTFLTADQRALMEEYFGYHPSQQYDDNKFWIEFGKKFDAHDPSPESADTPRSKFIHLWKVMAPLYENLHAALAEKGLATAGGVYRLAYERLEELAEESPVNQEAAEELRKLLPYRKIVMVGFNALSMSERAIFGILRDLPSPDGADEPLADFIWDATGPILNDHRNSAGRFVAINRRDFPAPEWVRAYMSPSHTSALPQRIDIVAAPSKVMQVKIAAEIINSLKEQVGEEPFDDARVAMVLPEESLLMPLLYSLPNNVGDANLTMGYPLKLTSVTSFLTLLRRMQLIRRDAKDYKGFDFAEVRNILGHPYAHEILGTQVISQFLAYFEHHHISVVRDSDLERLGERGMRLLSPLPLDATPFRTLAYIDDILAMIETTLPQDSPESNRLLNCNIELANVRAWREAILRLADAIEEYDVKLSMAGTMSEAYRLLQGESVAFEGEPLKGLQIMGMLETRAIDFEHLVVVAVNDKTIPRRSRQRSFLPNVLRRGYGLPPVNYAESLFAYYFYRMMSRARSVTLIYDNRVSGLTGGPSRYLMQLEYIYARNKVNRIEYKFELESTRPDINIIAKNGDVMAKLGRFLTDPAEGERRMNFSASSLKKYTHCPLKFYLQAVEGLRDDPAPENAVDAILYGNLVHHVMQHLLLPDKADHGIWLDPPHPVTKESIDAILDDEVRIRTLIHHYLNKEYYHLKEHEIDRPLQPDTEIVADVAYRHICNTLRHDRNLTPFNLYGCEVKGDLKYQMPGDERLINMTYAIDRIDDALCEGEATVRIVDYKTGSVAIHTPSIEDMLNGKSYSDHLFQLELYAILLNLTRQADGLPPLSIKPMIYPVAAIHLHDKRKLNFKSIPTIANVPLEYHDQEYEEIEEEHDSEEEAATETDTPRPTHVHEDFSLQFNTMLKEIFNPAIPFTGKYDPDKCRFCAFRSMCR